MDAWRPDDSVWCGTHTPASDGFCSSRTGIRFHEFHSRRLESDFGAVATFYCPIPYCACARSVYVRACPYGGALETLALAIAGRRVRDTEIVRDALDPLFAMVWQTATELEVFRRKLELHAVRHDGDGK